MDLQASGHNQHGQGKRETNDSADLEDRSIEKNPPLAHKVKNKRQRQDQIVSRHDNGTHTATPLGPFEELSEADGEGRSQGEPVQVSVPPKSEKGEAL